jgi:hypothetical protein
MRGRPTRNPYTRPAIFTLERLHAELGGAILENKQKHGFSETEASITNKLKRGTFSATFFLACIAALELEKVVLEEI